MPATMTLTPDQAARLARFRNAGAFNPPAKGPNALAGIECALASAKRAYDEAYDTWSLWEQQCNALTDAGKKLSASSASRLAYLGMDCDHKHKVFVGLKNKLKEL